MAKPDLLAAMRSKASGDAPVVKRTTATSPEATEKADNPHYRPGREGKRNVTGYFDASVKKQLKRLAAEQDRTIQDLLAEALNALFATHGKPEIVERASNER